jgi:TrpR-related protein YerC/YecD
MSKPKFEVNEKEYFREVHFLYEIISSLRNVAETKLFLKDILTRSELRMFKRRWHIACLLDQGHDIRDTARKADVSTQTVSKIKSILEEGRGGLTLALKRTRKSREPKEKNTRGSAAYRMGRRLIYGKNIDPE